MTKTITVHSRHFFFFFFLIFAASNIAKYTSFRKWSSLKPKTSIFRFYCYTFRYTVRSYQLCLPNIRQIVIRKNIIITYKKKLHSLRSQVALNKYFISANYFYLAVAGSAIQKKRLRSFLLKKGYQMVL